jgi:glutamyl-tRNA reductase
VKITLVGLNHRTAPVEIREQLAFGRDGVSTALMFFKKQFPGSEAAILSTCNRVEMLVVSEADLPGGNEIIRFLAEARDLPINCFKQYIYQFEDEQACRHFFRVISGLDSMILGETQIVNQIKQAYTLACEQGTTGRVLNRLFHHAFAVGKRARSSTAIADGKVSVSSVAIAVAQGIFTDLSSKQTLVVGAGEVARLVCQHLADSANTQRFVVMSRTLSNARTLAEACQAVSAPFEQLDEQLLAADIVLMATGASQPILTLEKMREIQKRRANRLIYLLDLAVPRNIDPAVGRLEGVYLYDIDDLGRIVSDNQNHRATALQQCENILDEEVTEFIRWLNELRLNPIIAQMYRDAQNVRDAELDRLLRKCTGLTDEQKQAIAQGIDRLVGKFMHPCVHSLRQTPTPEMLALAGAWHAATGNREAPRTGSDYVQ